MTTTAEPSLPHTALSIVFETPVLRGLDARGRRELEAALRVVRARRGERLYARGDRADSFFVLAEGNLDLYGARSPTADPSFVRTVSPGETFGEEATVTGHRQHDAYASSHVLAAEFPVHLFRRAVVRSGRSELADRMERVLRRGAASDLLSGTPLAQSLDAAGLDAGALDRAPARRSAADGGPSFRASLDALLDAVTFQSFARGQTVYRAGDASSALFVVGEGLVQIQTEDDERIRVRAYLARGDFFGDEELELARPRAATAIANGPSTILVIPARVVRAIALQDPELFSRLRRVALGENERQREVVEKAAGRATEHVFRDLYRLQVARSLLVIDLETCVRCGHCAWTCASLYGTSRLIRRGDKVVTQTRATEPSGDFDVFNLRGEDLALPKVAPVNGMPRSLMLPSSCQHCENPACMVDCPTGAIGKDAGGEVFVREELCTGCGSCARACPWTNIQMSPRPADAPRPQGIAADTVAVKCDLCRTYERGPACVQACPTQAIFRVDPESDFADVAALFGARRRASSEGRATAATARPILGWPAVSGAAIASAALAAWGLIMQSRGHLAPSKGAGYAAGWVAAFVMLGLLSYAAPKRLARLWLKRSTPNARPRATTSALGRGTRVPYVIHLVLGVFGLGVACVHAPGLRAGRGVFELRETAGSALFLAFVTASISGILLGLAYALVPRALARLERAPLLPEDFAREQSALTTRLYKSLTGRDELLKAVADKVLLPYARKFWGPLVLLASGRDLRTEERRVRVRIDTILAGRGSERLAGLDELVRTAVELRAMPAQRALTFLLRGLLPIHLALFAIALVMLAIHVLGVLRGGSP